MDAVILGGAGLAGYAQALATDLPVPLIDSASAGIEWLTGPPRPGLQAAPAGGDAPAWQGLAPALQQWLGDPGRR